MRIIDLVKESNTKKKKKNASQNTNYKNFEFRTRADRDQVDLAGEQNHSIGPATHVDTDMSHLNQFTDNSMIGLDKQQFNTSSF